MRTRKPAATSRGDTCHRCTALLLGDASQCSMCGWPAGVGYPPANGELEAAVSAVEPETAPDAGADAERAAAQLDALAGMAQRRSQPTPEPEPAAEASADEPGDVDPLTAPLDDLPETAADETSDQDATPIAAVAEAVVHQAAHPEDDDVAAAPSAIDSAPELPAPVVVPTTTTTAHESGRASSLARPVQLLVVAAAVLGLVLAGMQAAFGSPIDESMTAVALGVSLLQIAVWTAATITFLYWVSRAYREVAATSAHTQRHGPSMALIGWVIPVVGLFIGYRVLQDLWAGSDPQTRQQSDAKPHGARTIDIWLLGMVTALLFAYAVPVALGDSALWSGVAALSVLVAGLSLASVVSTISAWQDTPDAPSTAPVADDGTVTTRVDHLVTPTADENVADDVDEPVATAAE